MGSSLRSPNEVGDFTAVGYYFARELRKHQDIPIGILNVSWGASKIQAWMDPASQGIKSNPFAESPIANYLEKEREEHRKLLAEQAKNTSCICFKMKPMASLFIPSLELS